MKLISSFPHLFLTGAVLALAACASKIPAPTDAFQAADMAISSAEKDNAAAFAPLEMRAARAKIAAARVTPENEDDEAALISRRLANEARADAELASAKARLAKADAVNEQLQKNNSTLQKEIQRGPGG